MTNLDSTLKSRDITLPTKDRLVKAMVFLVVMCRCESWTMKKAEHRRIDAFELWCWRRLLRVPWTARRSNQSILKEISPEYSLERLMLKLKLQYFGHLIQRTDWLEKILMLGKIEGRRRRGWKRMRWLDGITDSMDVTLSKLRSWWWTGRPGMLQFIGSQRVRHDLATELNWNIFIVTSSNSKNKETENKGKKSSIICKLVPFETTLSQPCTKSLEKWEDLRLRISWVLSEHTSSLIMQVALQAP